MKSLWNNFKVAFAMFSKIPMPRADWTKENMKYMFCFFPFIGTVIGGLTMLVAYLGLRFGYQPGFVTAVLVLVPVFVTGGIHVDGLLDTSDALSSWQERSRRLEILKDSHAGAFAVITAAVYFIAWYGAYSQLFNSAENMRAIGILSLGFMVSRCLSGIGVITFPKAKADGTVAEFSRNSSDVLSRNVLIVYLVLLAAGMILIRPVWGSLAFVGALLIFWYYHHIAMKYFGGTTGDISGSWRWFLIIEEKSMEMIIGGAYQGKTEYARKQYPQLRWSDGGSVTEEELMNAQGVTGFQQYIRSELENGKDVSDLAEKIICKNPDIVLVSQEVGYGVVPVDAFDRKYREAVGRVCTKLAAYSHKVTRVICGIGTVIKDD